MILHKMCLFLQLDYTLVAIHRLLVSRKVRTCKKLQIVTKTDSLACLIRMVRVLLGYYLGFVMTKLRDDVCGVCVRVFSERKYG